MLKEIVGENILRGPQSELAESRLILVQAKCVRPAEQLLAVVTKIPKGFIVGFQNFAWSPKSQKY